MDKCLNSMAVISTYSNNNNKNDFLTTRERKLTTILMDTIRYE